MGDLIRLNTPIRNDSIVYINDEPKFLGRPGRIGRKYGIQIVEAVEDDYEENLQERGQAGPGFRARQVGGQ